MFIYDFIFQDFVCWCYRLLLSMFVGSLKWGGRRWADKEIRLECILHTQWQKLIFQRFVKISLNIKGWLTPSPSDDSKEKTLKVREEIKIRKKRLSIFFSLKFFLRFLTLSSHVGGKLREFSLKNILNRFVFLIRLCGSLSFLTDFLSIYRDVSIKNNFFLIALCNTTQSSTH